MKSSIFYPLITAAVLGAAAGCGDGGGDLDFSIRFAGTLVQPNNAPTIGKICALGECGESTSTGEFSFTAWDDFKGGDVHLTVTIQGKPSEAQVTLPKNADDVRLALAVDTDGQNLTVTRVEVLNTK